MDRRPFGTTGLYVSQLGFCLAGKGAALAKRAYEGGVDFFVASDAADRDVILRETGGQALVVEGPQDGKYTLRGFEGLAVKRAEKVSSKQKVEWLATPFNMMDQELTRSVIAPAARRGCAIVATHVLAGGALAGPLGHTPYGARVASLRSLVTARRTLAQAAIQFVLASEYVTCAVVRVSSEEHLDEALGALAAEPLSTSDLEMIFETYANRYDST